MHDIKYIRTDPEAFNRAMQKRGVEITAEAILEIDAKVRTSKTQLQKLQKQVNDSSKKIGLLKSQQAPGDEVSQLIECVEDSKRAIKNIENELQSSEAALLEHLTTLPNILSDDVPTGKDENDNICVKTHGSARTFDWEPHQHFELGEKLQMMDFVQTAKISGSRFVTLKSQLSRLERALVNFMLDINTKEFGYTEMSTPFMVRESTMFGIGQLPKFAEDSFSVDDGAYRLIPTAEVTLTSIVADMIIDYKNPIRMTAHTPCFRSEAGSAGRDTRGMIRLHQFSKVELVSVVSPSESAAEHERMLNTAETILKRLEIPYRVMLLCSQDTGFCAAKTYDIEAWLPGQKAYREISSCSNCHGFQARRMKARYRTETGHEFLHTLNGSSLPIGRTIVAIMENYQNSDGSISIPEKLIPYMDDIRKIEPYTL